MQPGKDNFNHWGAFLRMHANRDTSPVVIDRDATIDLECDRNGLAKSSQRLIGGVIEHLLHDMQRILGSCVHSRPLSDRLEALENPDRPFRVFSLACSHSLA